MAATQGPFGPKSDFARQTDRGTTDLREDVKEKERKEREEDRATLSFVLLVLTMSDRQSDAPVKHNKKNYFLRFQIKSVEILS